MDAGMDDVMTSAYELLADVRTRAAAGAETRFLATRYGRLQQQLITTDLPRLLAALEAVLAEHQVLGLEPESDNKPEQDWYPEVWDCCPTCIAEEALDHEVFGLELASGDFVNVYVYPCPTVEAITAALTRVDVPAEAQATVAEDDCASTQATHEQEMHLGELMADLPTVEEALAAVEFYRPLTYVGPGQHPMAVAGWTAIEGHAETLRRHQRMAFEWKHCENALRSLAPLVAAHLATAEEEACRG